MLRLEENKSNRTEGITKLVISNDYGGTPDRAKLGMFVNDMKSLTRAVQSAINVGAYFETKMKTIDPSSGRAVFEMYIQSSEYPNAQSAVNYLLGKWSSSSSHSDNYVTNTVNVTYKRFTREFHGQRAQAQAMADVASVAGGRIRPAPTPKKPDRFEVLLPFDWSESTSPETVRGYADYVFTESTKLSKEEQRNRKAKEIEVQQRREEQNQVYQLKMIARDKAEKDAFSKQADKLIADADAEYDAELEAKDRVRKRVQAKNARLTAREKAMEDKREADAIKQQEKAEEQHKAVIHSRLLKIVALLGIGIDIARRILTASLQQASEVKKNEIQARDINSSYGAIRLYNYSDKAMGLPEGTTFGALKDIQKMFGNTANIDTNALKWLSMVMGNDVGEMVQSGLGGKNPEKLAEAIYDAFFKSQQAGIDQYGNYVGQDQARRSLVTLLESVSPDLARVFSRMVEANTYGINKGRINNYRDYLDLTRPTSGSLTNADWQEVSAIGEVIDQISAKFKNLKSILSAEFILNFGKWIDKINGLSWGASPEEFQASVETAQERLFMRSGELATRAHNLKSLVLSSTGYSGTYADLMNDPASLAYIANNDPAVANMINKIAFIEGVSLPGIDKQIRSDTPTYNEVQLSEEYINAEASKRVLEWTNQVIAQNATLIGVGRYSGLSWRQQVKGLGVGATFGDVASLWGSLTALEQQDLSFVTDKYIKGRFGKTTEFTGDDISKSGKDVLESLVDVYNFRTGKTASIKFDRKGKATLKGITTDKLVEMLNDPESRALAFALLTSKANSLAQNYLDFSADTSGFTQADKRAIANAQASALEMYAGKGVSSYTTSITPQGGGKFQITVDLLNNGNKVGEYTTDVNLATTIKEGVRLETDLKSMVNVGEENLSG